MKKCITEGCQTMIFDDTFGDKCIVCLEKESSLDRVYKSAPPPIEPIITEPLYHPHDFQAEAYNAGGAYAPGIIQKLQEDMATASRLFQRILEVHGSDMKGDLIIKIVRMQAKLRGK